MVHVLSPLSDTVAGSIKSILMLACLNRNLISYRRWFMGAVREVVVGGGRFVGQNFCALQCLVMARIILVFVCYLLKQLVISIDMIV